MIARVWRGATRARDAAAFAGADIAISRFLPEDDAYLVEREPTVAHFEVVVGAPIAG